MGRALLVAVLLLGGPAAQNEVYIGKKKGEPGPYGRNRPHITSDELKAAHAGKAGWSQMAVVADATRANYIYQAPGQGSERHYHHIDEWWVVLEGEIRWEIEGQRAFVARAGDFVYCPKETWHTITIAGSAPAARLAVGIPDFKHEHDVAAKGKPGDYGSNALHLTLDEIKARKGRGAGGRPLVYNDYCRAVFIHVPPGHVSSKHYHLNDEWWIVLEGEIQWEIENQGRFVARPGSIVFCPRRTWHEITVLGARPSIRVGVGIPEYKHEFE